MDWYVLLGFSIMIVSGSDAVNKQSRDPRAVMQTAKWKTYVILVLDMEALPYSLGWYNLKPTENVRRGNMDQVSRLQDAKVV